MLIYFRYKSIVTELITVQISHCTLIQNICPCTKVYPKVSGLASWSDNCKCYSYMPLGTVVSLFCESV